MADPGSAAASTIAVEDLKDWQGQEVVDIEGERLGRLDDVLYDTETDLPAFAAVKRGRLAKKLILVPLAGATVGRAFLRAPVTRDEFKRAPSFDPDAELTADDESAAYAYYGLQYREAGLGARRLAKH